MSLEIELLSAVLPAVGAESLTYIYKAFSKKKETLSKSKDPAEAIREILIEEQKTVSEDKIKNITEEALQSTYNYIDGIREERLRQAKYTFNIALSLTIIGVVIIFAGIILVYLSALTLGIVTSAVGIVSEILSIILFKFNRDVSNKLDIIAKDLNIIERARLGMRLIDKMSDQINKDQSIRELVKDINNH